MKKLLVLAALVAGLTVFGTTGTAKADHMRGGSSFGWGSSGFGGYNGGYGGYGYNNYGGYGGNYIGFSRPGFSIQFGTGNSGYGYGGGYGGFGGGYGGWGGGYGHHHCGW